MNYNNTNHMYLLTGDGDGGNVTSIGILKTTDGGETWNNTAFSVNVTQGYRYFKLIMHPDNPNIQLAVGNAGILRTTNAWTTYTSVQSGVFYDIEFRPNNPTTMYACTGTQFYRSTDTGATWTQITSGVPTTASRMAIGVTVDHTAYVYLFAGPNVGTGAFVGMYRSYDSGLSFDLKSNSPNILGYSAIGNDNKNQTTYDHALVISKDDEADMIIGGINCWKSIDFGSSWSNLSVWDNLPGVNYTHADIHALEQNPLNGTVYCGSDGGLFYSSDFGENWGDITSGLAITQSYRIAGYESDVDLITNGTQDNGSNKWTGGSTMLHMLGADGMDCMIDHSNSNILYNTIQYGALEKSTNGGASFDSIQPPGSSGSWVTPIVMHATTPTTIYGGYSDIYKSTNGGSSWVNQGYSGSGAMALGGSSNPSRVYACPDDSKTIYMSNNGGTSYTTLTGLPSGTVSFIAVNPLNSYDVFVTFSGYTSGQKVYRSTNAGTTWTNISGSLPNIPINCIAYENTGGSPNNALYIGTDVGVYYRDDDIGDWIPFMNGLPATMVFDLEINETSGVITAGTFGRGLWRSDLYSDCSSSYNLTIVNDPSNPNYTGFQHYEASSYILSSRVITGGVGTDVTYQAGDYVKLLDGFHAKEGNEFEAKLGACTGSGPEPPPGAGKQKTGVYVGVPIYAQTDQNEMDNADWNILGESEMGGVKQELAVNVYPNPFNSNITIAYETMLAGEIEISIFNQLGILVNNVVNKNHQAGGEAYVWNASNLPNGVYFVHIKSHDKMVKKKIVKLN